MLETLRTWLNGSREYYTGVAIYASVGTNEALLSALKDGHNEFRERKLQEELLSICKKLKENGNNKHYPDGNNILDTGSKAGNNLHSKKQNPANIQNGLVFQLPENKEGPNAELYNACKLEADKLYKATMNDRAILFALTSCESFENPNLPHKIEERAKLAIDVVRNHQKVSQLYDQADYVRAHGHLPDQGEAEENEYDHLPDNLVKQTLDNLRKNYNKMTKRDPTPDRIALQQKHENNIKKLEAKWLLLKPK